MKKLIINGIIVFVVALLSPQFIEAQGIVYLSNLGQPSASSDAIGNDSWLAESFETGTNANGYTLNSIQLSMANASGNPSGLTVMVYSAIFSSEFSPGTNLDTLNGSSNPATTGIYTYTDASSVMLLPSTAYFIVLTAGTVIANGAYGWNNTSAFPLSYNPNGGWRAPLGFATVDNYQSSDGSHWNVSGTYPEFAIAATPVPEPSPSLLLLLGSGVFLYVRRTFHR